MGDFDKIKAIVSTGNASVETRDANGHSLLSLAIINQKAD